jgi:hypothetical protein
MVASNDVQELQGPARSLALKRPANAEGGHAFMGGLTTASVPAREAAMLAEILRGNVPPSLTRLAAVPVAGGGRTGTIFVAPDYLGIGSDADFVRTPLNALSAQAIADQLGCVLPTTKLVNAIWHAAPHKLAPLPWGPPFDASMLSTARFVAHSDRIAAQRAATPLEELVAGDKKDVVLTKAIATHPGHVAIYGWQLPNGQPIQPLATVHAITYADYSHGVRLVLGTMLVDGVEIALADVLADASLCALVTDEGPGALPRYGR